MDKVIEELDDAKAEIEKLRAECRAKAESFDNLKRSHTELLSKIQELNLKLEKQSEEVNAKTDDVYAAEQLLDDLKCNLKEKEAIIKGLNALNERLRTDSNKKLREFEEEKTELLCSLEEGNSKNMGLEQKIRVLEEEIEGFKERFVSVSQKKCSEVNKMAKVSKEMRERDDMLMKSEEEYRKLEDQLKWKKEQFLHLEEAHQKLRDLLRTKEAEWEVEKSAFLDEISTLQENLDSQTRVSKDLQRRLESCNQALAHEESRRKCLEIQVSESKLGFETMFSECEEAKSKLECLTSDRDKDIAYLRTILGEKEAGCKEIEYKAGKLEEENQELKVSLKEVREAQIQEAGSSKLRNKLKSLEQIHKDCSTRLNAKEAEWRSELENVKEELNFCRSELETKDLQTKQLKIELDDCNSLMTSLILQREENWITAFVLKSLFLEARLHNQYEKAEKDLKNTELLNAQENLEDKREKGASLLREMDLKNAALFKAQENLEEESEKGASLLKEIETLKLAEEEKLLLQKEIDGHKEILKESFASQARLKSELRKALNSLDRANDELAQKFCDGNEVEFELQIWKSIAERLKVDLEQNHQMRKEVEDSLLEQVSTEVNLREERDGLIHVLQERESRIEELQQKLLSVEAVTPSRKGQREKADDLDKEMEMWEQEWLRKELEGAILAQIDAEKIHQHEKESLNKIVQEKDQRIKDLRQIMRSLEEDFENSSTSFSSELVKMREEINLLHKAWEKMVTTLVLKEVAVEEKNLIILELENDSNILQQKLELQKKSFSSLKARKDELEADLANSDEEKRNLLENALKYSAERESLIGLIEDLSDRFSKLSSLDVQSVETLGKIVQGFNALEGDELFDPAKENLKILHPSPTGKRVEISVDERSPLRARNY